MGVLDQDALELTRSGWLASNEEGATLLQQAIERDDVPIARRLIELGSDLDGPSNNRLQPLLSARSSAMVDLLVRAGANPNERPIGRVAARTPLMTTSYKDAAVAEALLKAGAHLEDVDTRLADVSRQPPQRIRRGVGGRSHRPSRPASSACIRARALRVSASSNHRCDDAERRVQREVAVAACGTVPTPGSPLRVDASAIPDLGE